MQKFDFSKISLNSEKTLKTFMDTQFFTGNHPTLRRLQGKKNRPSEFGHKIWPTSFIVMDYLKKQSLIPLQNLRALEIGCGWGHIGSFLAKNFSCEVTCSDIDPLVLPIAEEHARLNRVEIATCESSFENLSTLQLTNYELILGIEICYSEETARQLMKLVTRAFQANIKYFVVADPGRPGFDEFVQFCQKTYWTHIEHTFGGPNGKSTQILTVSKRN